MKDTIIKNACVFTDNTFKISDIIIKDNIIDYIGSIHEANIKEEEYEILNLKKNTVIPSFFDSHTHFYNYALSLNCIKLEDCRSIDEIRFAIRDYIRNNDREIVFGRGWSKSISNKKIPSRSDIDEITKDHIVLLESKDSHSVILNSKALDFCGINESTYIKNGIIEKTPDGKLNGLLAEDAVQLARPIYDRIYKVDHGLSQTLIQEGSKILFSLGITSIFNIENIFATNRLINAIDNNIFLQNFFTTIPESELDKINDIPQKYLRGVKCFLDGALGNLEAAMLEPYLDHDNSYGALLKDYNGLIDTIKKAYNYKLPIIIHAIGDKANKTALDALRDTNHLDCLYPNRIEHGQLLFESFLGSNYPQDIVFSMQPCHYLTDLKPIQRFWGHERAKYAFAFKTILKNGNKIIFNTDLPIEKPDPLYGVYAAVKRRDKNNYPDTAYIPEEALSIEEAIAFYTTVPHKIYGMDNEIKVGNKPCFIVYNKSIDFDKVKYDDLKEIKVDYSFIDDKKHSFI